VSAGSYSCDTFCTLDFESFDPTPEGSVAGVYDAVPLCDTVEGCVDPMAEESMPPAEQTTTALPLVSEVEIHEAMILISH